MSIQSPGPAPKPRKKPSKARLWLLLHGWMGLPFWAYLLLICLTGTIATLSEEFLWLVDPEVRAHASEAPPLSADALVAAVIAQRPGSRLASLEFPDASYLAPKVELLDPAGVERTYYVDAGSGHIQGESTVALPFPEFIRGLHGWLLMPWNGHYSWGWYAVTLTSLPILGSMVTGILIYKKFWRAYLHPRLRIGKGARTFWGDLHRLAGIWSLPFIAIIGITGTYGNVLVPTGTRNALAILELFGRTDVPVYAGPQREGFEVMEISQFIHGVNGIGETELYDAARAPERLSAVDFMVQSAHRFGDDLVIVPVGPLTTVAAAVEKDEHFAALAHIVCMGGALTVPGNVTPCAEANINQDPEAADLVFRQCEDVTMVGLDVTLQTLLTTVETEKWRALKTAGGDFLARAGNADHD